MTTINRLTPLKVKALDKPGRHADGGNLYCVVAPTGAKTWSFMYRAPGTGRQREAGFGSTDALSLKEARERARQGRALIKQGQDPLAHWQEAKRAARPSLTFAEAAEAHFAKKRLEWKSQKAGANEVSLLNRCAKPLMKLPVDAVDTAAVLKVIKPLWTEKPDTASRLRQRIEAVLNAGYVLISLDRTNPARWRGHLDHLLPKPKLGQTHYTAMPYREVPAFVAELRQRSNLYSPPLEFVILTGVRAMEGLGAKWSEVDLDARVWTVPPARMKAGRDHRVPLSARAVEILRQMRAERPDDEMVFRGGFAPLNAKGCERLLAKMGWKGKATTHGFRSSFRDWVSEQTATPHAVAEACLSHQTGDATSRAYARSDLLEQRRAVMTQWSEWLDGGRGDVVPFRAVENAS
jgi:integrase